MKKFIFSAILAASVVGVAGAASAGNDPGVYNFGQCHTWVQPSQRSQLAPGVSPDNAGPITINSNVFVVADHFDGGNTCSV